MKSWRGPLPSAPFRFGVVLLLGLLAASAGSLAQDSSPTDAAFRRVSNRLLCQCGCNYMVLSCNHLECPSATYIRRVIRTSLEAGKSEDAIVAGFVEEYGVRILPEPLLHQFQFCPDRLQDFLPRNDRRLWILHALSLLE